MALANDANDYVDWILENLRAGLTPDSFFRSSAFKTSVKRRKKEWFNKTVPDTLQKITINSIVKERKRFLMPILGNFSGPENPFTNLPRALAGDLLEEMHYQGEYAGKLMLVLQLLNPQTTEFDYTTIRDHKLDQVIFRHMLHNCPKVQKVQLSYQVWHDKSSFLLKTHPDDLFPMMATQWKSLSFLSVKVVVDIFAVRECFSSVHTSLVHAVCTNLPNLSGLEMDVVFECFAQEEVALLSKMQHLKFLNLTLCACPNPGQKDVSIVIETAGTIPKLEKFAFNFRDDENKWAKYYADFVDEYAKKYPNKKLTIESIWISAESYLEKPWPQVLAVEDLHLKDLSNITNIMALDTPIQKLHLEGMAPQLVYSLLEKFGPMGVNTLDVIMENPSGRQAGLDFFKVFSNCPYLDHTNICISTPHMLISTVSQVTPEQFKNCEYFAINPEKKKPFFITKSEINLQKKVYLGIKRKLKFLMLINQSQFMALDSVLMQEMESCLDELEQVGLFFPYDKDYFQAAAKMVLSLFKRSPCLKRVMVYKKRKFWRHPEIPVWFSQLMKAFKLKTIIDYDEKLPFYKKVKEEFYYSSDSDDDESDSDSVEEEEEEVD